MTINEAKEIEIILDFGSFDVMKLHSRKMMLYEVYYMNTIYELAKKYGFENDELYKEANSRMAIVHANLITDLVGMDMHYHRIKSENETLMNETLLQRISRKLKKR